MKNYWLDGVKKRKRNVKELLNNIPIDKRMSLVPGIFHAKVVNNMDPLRSGRVQIRITPSVQSNLVKFPPPNGHIISKNAAGYVWVLPLAKGSPGSTGGTIMIPPLGANIVICQDTGGILYYIGVKIPVATPIATLKP